MAKNSKIRKADRLVNDDKRPYAVVRHVRVTPYKMRSVIDTVRGKDVISALAILGNMDKASTGEVVYKLVASAAANAEVKGYAVNELVIAEIFADEGPTMKRIRAKDHGKAHRILKRTCHVTAILDNKENI